MINVVSLFSGIGSFEKGLEKLGIPYTLKGFSEIDKYAVESYCAVHGVDKELNLGDVSKIKNDVLPKDVDLITYGFPCQDISVAGSMQGINGNTRSGLLFEAERIIEHTKPKYAIAENVKNLVSKKFKDDFESLLDRLDSYGYNNYWQVLNAKDYGIPQNRERVFIVSIRKDVDDGTFTFPEKEELSIRLKDLLDDRVEDKYIINNERSSKLLRILDDKELLENKRFCCDSSINKPEKRVVVESKQKRLGGLYDTDKNKRQAGAVWDKEGLSPTIDTMQGGHREPLVVVKEGTKKGYKVAEVGDSINLAFEGSTTRRGRVGKGVAQTITTSASMATFQKVKVDDSVVPSVAKNFERDKDLILESDKEIFRSECDSGWCDNQIGLKVSPTLRASNHNTHVLDEAYVIRKLTPLECWRLMGFTDDDYFKARKRLEETFYNGADRSNSQMYKQAGNSIVVNVVEGIFKNLLGGKY